MSLLHSRTTRILLAASLAVVGGTFVACSQLNDGAESSSEELQQQKPQEMKYNPQMELK